MSKRLAVRDDLGNLRRLVRDGKPLTDSCECCGDTTPGLCCGDGRLGHLLVRRVSDGLYELLTPLTISATVPFYLDAPSAGFEDNYIDALFIMPPLPTVGEAVLCDDNPTEPGGDIYRALFWRCETPGAITYGPSASRVSLPATVSVFVSMLIGDVTAVQVIAGWSQITFVPPQQEPPCGEIQRSLLLDLYAEYRRSLPPRLPAPRITTSLRVTQRLFRTNCAVPGALSALARECQVYEIRGCLNAGTTPSAPINLSASGSVLDPKVRGYFARCANLVNDIPCAGWQGCPSIEHETSPWLDISAGDTSTLAATVAITLDPEPCADEVLHIVADCETPSGVCVIDGVVRDPVCCEDPSLPGCTEVVFGPCCQDGPTPTHWTFLQNTVLRMRAWWEVIELSPNLSAINRAWYGEIFRDRPTAPTQNSNCQAAQNSVLPSQNPGGYAYRVIYPSGGVPQAFNNTYQLLAALGRNLALPSASARIRLQVTDDLNANVVTHDAFQTGTSLLTGRAGVTLNRSVDRRFFAAQPESGEAFYYAANQYVFTTGNAPSNWNWRVRVFAEVVAYNISRCAPGESDNAIFAGGVATGGLRNGPSGGVLLREDGSRRTHEDAMRVLHARDEAMRSGVVDAGQANDGAAIVPVMMDPSAMRVSRQNKKRLRSVIRGEPGAPLNPAVRPERAGCSNCGSGSNTGGIVL